MGSRVLLTLSFARSKQNKENALQGASKTRRIECGVSEVKGKRAFQDFRDWSVVSVVNADKRSICVVDRT